MPPLLSAAPGDGVDVASVDAEIVELAISQPRELAHRLAVAEPAVDAGKQGREKHRQFLLCVGPRRMRGLAASRQRGAGSRSGGAAEGSEEASLGTSRGGRVIYSPDCSRPTP